MNQNEKKGGKGISAPKSKKSRVTLPLYPTEDSGDEMLVATTRSSLRHDKKQGKSTKTATKPASPPPADITSEGDDDDDFADGGSDQGEALMIPLLRRFLGRENAKSYQRLPLSHPQGQARQMMTFMSWPLSI